MQLKKNYKYQITWRDTMGASGWRTEKEVREWESPIVYSLGFFIGTEKGCYLIGGDKMKTNQDYGRTFQIPKESVVKIRELK